MPMNLGFTRGQIIQEFYVDDDVDQKLREAVEASTAEQLVDVDYGDVVDGAIVWWRADDAEEEDLADVLVDALSNLDDGGLIWVLIPKPGRTGSLPVADVEDAATIAGLHSTTAASVGSQSALIRLTARPRQRKGPPAPGDGSRSRGYATGPARAPRYPRRVVAQRVDEAGAAAHRGGPRRSRPRPRRTGHRPRLPGRGRPLRPGGSGGPARFRAGGHRPCPGGVAARGAHRGGDGGGAGGPHPVAEYLISWSAHVGPLAQSARASGLHPEGHRFEPGRAHSGGAPTGCAALFRLIPAGWRPADRTLFQARF